MFLKKEGIQSIRYERYKIVIEVNKLLPSQERNH
jgi:hypothetical protein